MEAPRPLLLIARFSQRLRGAGSRSAETGLASQQSSGILAATGSYEPQAGEEVARREVAPPR